MSFISDLGRAVAKQFIHDRLAIPAADKQKVAEKTAEYTDSGDPLTVSDLDAADKAIIDYVEGRIEGTLHHK